MNRMSSSETRTCAAPSVADGAPNSLIVAWVMTRCVLLSRLTMSDTRVNRVAVCPLTR